MASILLSTDAERILAEALALAPAERAAVAERLLASVVPTDPEHDRRWAAEAESRVAAVDAGQLDLIPADVVFAEIAEELKRS